MSVHIIVDNLTLAVPLYVQPERKVRGWSGILFGAAFDPPRRQFTRLLSSISFEAREGDRIAILGRNGAGKSTLLRVLNGVYAPTSGSVEVAGSCQSLLNISLGFNNEATVRENIFLRGTAMGISAAGLRDQMEPILEFSGLTDKSSHRLRTLSSGQRVRLGFAISTSFQHDIMLMDEWLGAGDSQFMTKAKDRMASRVGGSKIVMLASHSTGLLREICNRGLVLEAGKLVFAGGITESLRSYHELMAAHREETPSAIEGGVHRPAAYGYVEQLSCEAGRLSVRGWLVDTEGGVPAMLAVSIRGERRLATAVRRFSRPDVMRHMGLSTDACGFEADFAVGEGEQAGTLGADFEVLAGHGPMPDGQIKLAGAVIAQLQSAPGKRVPTPHTEEDI